MYFSNGKISSQNMSPYLHVYGGFTLKGRILFLGPDNSCFASVLYLTKTSNI